MCLELCPHLCALDCLDSIARLPMVKPQKSRKLGWQFFLSSKHTLPNWARNSNPAGCLKSPSVANLKTNQHKVSEKGIVLGGEWGRGPGDGMSVPRRAVRKAAKGCSVRCRRGFSRPVARKDPGNQTWIWGGASCAVFHHLCTCGARIMS